MKKIIIFIICIVVIIFTIFYAKYLKYKQNQAEIKEYNLEYEVCLNKQIDGRELTTIINRAVDNNEKNSVTKDEQGFYIGNEINSVQIEIQMIDLDTTYKMETIYNGGMTNFIGYYNSIYFECEQINYNKAGKVKYLKFVQKTI